MRIFICLTLSLVFLSISACSSTGKYITAAREARERGAYEEALQSFQNYFDRREGDAALTAEFNELRRLYIQRRVLLATGFVETEADRTVPQYVLALRTLEDSRKWAGESEKESLEHTKSELSRGLAGVQHHTREVLRALRGALRSEDHELSKRYLTRLRRLDPNLPALKQLEPDLARLGFYMLKPTLEESLRHGDMEAARGTLKSYADSVGYTKHSRDVLDRMLRELRQGALDSDESGSRILF